MSTPPTAPRATADGASTPIAARGEGIRSYFSILRRRLLIAFVLAYLIPLILLNLYFHLQFRATMSTSGELHLMTIAESLRNTVDLFLQDRLLNLVNLSQDLSTGGVPSAEEMEAALLRIQEASSAFVDLGIIDQEGRQIAYAGPYPRLLGDDYHDDDWFRALRDDGQGHYITNIYLGHRRAPHFTIAVQMAAHGESYVLRATMDPDRFRILLEELQRNRDVDFALVDRQGRYQVVDHNKGELMGLVETAPPEEIASGASRSDSDEGEVVFAWAWLQNVPWALTVRQSLRIAYAEMYNARRIVILSTALFMLAVMALGWFASDRFLRRAEAGERDRLELRLQLVHAAKLASVGELAAGIAHEINNPLAIVGVQSGLIRDMLDPDFGMDSSPEAILGELTHVDDAVRRAKTITSQLLSYARKYKPTLSQQDVNQLLDDTIAGIKEEELRVNNIEVAREFEEGLPTLPVDADGLRQVFLNLINNAQDAIEGEGRISLITRRVRDQVHVTIQDTGSGISVERMETIFQPFFTTKDVGEGTGLGLSVSLSIIEGMQGTIQVQSLPGSGSAFTVVLPIRLMEEEGQEDGGQH